jgi:4-coumarate--CoA ligase
VQVQLSPRYLTVLRYPDIDIPNVDIWMFLFERRNREFPDSKGTCCPYSAIEKHFRRLNGFILVIFLDPNSQRSYTYAQVKDAAVQFGKGLVGLWEWRKGDVISFTANSIDTPVVIWGAHWAGGIVSPANPGYTAEELAFQLRDARAKALVTQKSLLKVARKAAKIAGIPEDRIILIGDERDEEMRFKHFTSIRSSSETDRYRRAKTDPKKDVAFIVYSSGTTGYPKGASLSHENIVAGVLILEAGEAGNLGWKGNQDNKGDRVLSFLPFYHIYGKFIYSVNIKLIPICNRS